MSSLSTPKKPNGEDLFDLRKEEMDHMCRSNVTQKKRAIRALLPVEAIPSLTIECLLRTYAPPPRFYQNSYYYVHLEENKNSATQKKDQTSLSRGEVIGDERGSINSASERF